MPNTIDIFVNHSSKSYEGSSIHSLKSRSATIGYLTKHINIVHKRTLLKAFNFNLSTINISIWSLINDITRLIQLSQMLCYIFLILK